MIFKILATIGLTLLSGWLYRAGGQGHPYNTKYRDFGVPLCAVLTMLIWGMAMSWWCWLITFLLMFGSMTTYHKWASRLIGYTDDDVHWISWLVTGFVYGLTAILYTLQSGNWLGFGIRTIFLALFTMIWSVLIDDVEYEERGRGWAFNGSLPLLLI